jgi:hypothetical protein
MERFAGESPPRRLKRRLLGDTDSRSDANGDVAALEFAGLDLRFANASLALPNGVKFGPERVGDANP